MKSTIILAAALAGLLAVAAVPSHSDHVQITISLVPGTEAECAGSATCVGLSAATLDAGGEVIWSNDGSEQVTITSGDAGSHHIGEDFGPITLDPGQTYSRMFHDAGEFSFHLVDHPWMAGTITVVSDEDHTHGDPADDGMEAGGHPHATLEAEGPLAIGIDALVEDGGGLNVHVMTEGWTWTPENVNDEHVPGEGHAHIYVDGVKSYVYGPYYHVPGLEPGSHHIRVTLNANAHDEMHANGFPVEAVATVVVPEHDHEHEPAPVTGTASMSIDATAHVDAEDGYNLEVSVTDFAVSGEGVNGDHVEGEGYVMVSIDGEQYNRLYGHWLKLTALEPGMRTITVSLFTNDHNPYHWDDEPIEASITIHVPEGGDQMEGGDGHTAHDDDHAGDGHAHGSSG